MSRQSTTFRAAGLAVLLLLAIGAAPVLRVRRADRAERRRQPAPDDDVRGLPRRRGALRHRVPVRRRRRGVRLAHPAPGVPSSVEKGGDWTLQRLVRETEPIRGAALVRRGAPPRDAAEVLMEVRIDALDITVLKGGADEVGMWAKDHGFRLPPDAPEVLDFYAKRCPIFLAAAFDADAAAARGQRSATARRSTSRSRPPTRGSRCGSSPSARPATSGSRPTCSSSPTAAGAAAPHRTARLDPRLSDAGQRSCWRTCAPTGAWSGSRTRLAVEDRDRRSRVAALVRPRDRRQRPGRAVLRGGRARRPVRGPHAERCPSTGPRAWPDRVVGVGGLLLLVRWRPSSAAA